MSAASINRRMERDIGPRVLAFNMPAWKIGLYQDIVILGMLSILCLIFPRNIFFGLMDKLLLSFSPTIFLVQSGTTDFLLNFIGISSLGLCYVLYSVIKNNDANIAATVAVYHLIFGLVGTSLVWSSGGINKLLLPFIAHDVLTALFIFSAVPNSSPLWNVLSKLHLS